MYGSPSRPGYSSSATPTRPAALSGYAYGAPSTAATPLGINTTPRLPTQPHAAPPPPLRPATASTTTMPSPSPRRVSPDAPVAVPMGGGWGQPEAQRTQQPARIAVAMPTSGPATAMLDRIISQGIPSAGRGGAPAQQPAGPPVWPARSPSSIANASPGKLSMTPGPAVKPPDHYLDLVQTSLHVHGFRCGAEVVARSAIHFGTRVAVPEGGGGVVRGPADNGDTRRLLVDFEAFHTALNVLPAELSLYSEYPTRCPRCSLGLPGSPAPRQPKPAPRRRPSATPLERSSRAQLTSRFYHAWRLWVAVARPQSAAFALNAPEGDLPPPDDGDEGDATAGGGGSGDGAPPPPTPTPDVGEGDGVPHSAEGGEGGGVGPDGGGGAVDDAPEGFEPPPEEGGGGGGGGGAGGGEGGSGELLERNAFYDRFPEVRPTRAAMRALQEENEQLRRELQALRGGGGAPPSGAAAPPAPGAGAEDPPADLPEGGAAGVQ